MKKLSKIKMIKMEIKSHLRKIAIIGTIGLAITLFIIGMIRQYSILRRIMLIIPALIFFGAMEVIIYYIKPIRERVKTNLIVGILITIAGAIPLILLSTGQLYTVGNLPYDNPIHILPPFLPPPTPSIQQLLIFLIGLLIMIETNQQQVRFTNMMYILMFTVVVALVVITIVYTIRSKYSRRIVLIRFPTKK